jgi:DNA helicase-2/ATP-dependent DNA helicase PcrA
VLYQDDYFDEAFAHVRQVWSGFQADATVANAVNQELIVQRPSGAVALRVDRVEQTPAGSRLVQLKSGRRGKEDHLSTRIMLYPLAAAANSGEIAIHYTATNETLKAAPKGDVLERHTARIDALLAGISGGHWEPKPGPQCDTCPFNLICPV